MFVLRVYCIWKKKSVCDHDVELCVGTYYFIIVFFVLPTTVLIYIISTVKARIIIIIHSNNNIHLRSRTDVIALGMSGATRRRRRLRWRPLSPLIKGAHAHTYTYTHTVQRWIFIIIIIIIGIQTKIVYFNRMVG